MEQSEPLHVSQNGSIKNADRTEEIKEEVQIEYDVDTTDLR